jgi:hypothetical protein
MQACRPNSIITPLLFGLAVEMDHAFGSKFLVTELARLGFSLSYDEVIRFKQSVVMSVAPDSVDTACADALLNQFIGDNADHNVRTLDGYGTFHGMGIIVASVFPRGHFGCPYKPIARLKRRLPAAEMVRARGIKIVPYVRSAKSGLTSIKMTGIRKLQTQPALPPLCKLSLVWHVSYFSTDPAIPRPNWSGYMRTNCIGEHLPAAQIRMLPIIDMDPLDETCIYSTLLFVEKQSEKLQGRVPCITFDQPLFIKAVDIGIASGLKVVVRLGGFHTLMNFLCAVGGVRDGSGVDEALQVNYRANTVEHMLSGKAVSRAVRCYFLYWYLFPVKAKYQKGMFLRHS